MFDKNISVVLTYDSYLKRTLKVRDIIKNSAKECNVETLDPAQVLCPANECISTYQDRPIYRDGDHLSEYGNKLLTPMFKEALNP